MLGNTELMPGNADLSQEALLSRLVDIMEEVDSSGPYTVSQEWFTLDLRMPHVRALFLLLHEGTLRMSDLSAKVDEVLMEFALAALLAKGESLPNYGIVGDRIFSVLLGKNYLRYLALQCLNRLEKPRNGSVQFVQLLFACIQSDVPEAQDYAALATTTLTGVDEDSVALCLKTLRSDQAVQMAVVVNILGRIGRYDEQVATALLHEISNKERSGPLGAVSDLAASALLRILAS